MALGCQAAKLSAQGRSHVGNSADYGEASVQTQTARCVRRTPGTSLAKTGQRCQQAHNQRPQVYGPKRLAPAGRTSGAAAGGHPQQAAVTGERTLWRCTGQE